MIYLELILGFLKVGCMAFGGAYGAIPLIQDVVYSYHWLNEETLTYMIALSESTPGPIMVNLATYIGSNQAGLPGALLATLSVVLPSFIIVLIVTAVLKNAIKNQYVKYVLRGLKPCVIGIVLATGICMLLKNTMLVSLNIKALLIASMLFIVSYFYKKVSPIQLIIISAILGIVVYAF